MLRGLCIRFAFAFKMTFICSLNNHPSGCLEPRWGCVVKAVTSVTGTDFPCIPSPEGTMPKYILLDVSHEIELTDYLNLVGYPLQPEAALSTSAHSRSCLWLPLPQTRTCKLPIMPPISSQCSQFAHCQG
jgi:hypothetical protein